MTYCTLFDSNYLAKGLAMYESLRQHSPQSRLFVLAMDDKCQEMLGSYNIPGITAVPVSSIDDPLLKKAESNRSRAEFCWTCGAYCTYYFITEYNLPEICYLDSDLMFFNSPAMVEDEIADAGASVGLTPHFMRHTLFGKYCVQYVYFKNDDRGIRALKWWRDKCLEWCYCKLEDGKYADQKYLETMRENFPGVYEIENRGVGVAYWNAANNTYGSGTLTFDGKEWPIIFFHYSGINIRVENGRFVLMVSEYFPKKIEERFIAPYVKLLESVYSRYLGVEVKGYEMVPISRGKLLLKKFSYTFRRMAAVEDLLFFIMKLKYREHRTPYNEKL